MAVNKPYHAVRVNPKFYEHPEDMKDNRGDHWRDLSINRAQFDHILERTNPETLCALDALWGQEQEDPFHPNAEISDMGHYPWMNLRTAVSTAAGLRTAVDTATAKLPHHERAAFCESIVEELTNPFTKPVLQLSSSYGLTRKEDRNPAFNVLIQALQKGLREIQRHRRALTDLLAKPDERDWTEQLRAADIAATLNRTHQQATDTLGRAAALIAAEPAAVAADAIFTPAIRRNNQMSKRTGNILEIYLNENPQTHQDHIVRQVSELCSRSMQAETERNLTAMATQRENLAQELDQQTRLAPKANLCERAMLDAFQAYQGYQPGRRTPQHLHLQDAFNEATEGYTPEQRSDAAHIVAQAINWRLHKETNSQTLPAGLEDQVINSLRRKKQELLRIEANSRLSRATHQMATAIASTDPNADMSATGYDQGP